MSSKTAGVEQYLLAGINSGEFPPHGKIPSQFKLMQRFNCSRMTVQRALKNLTAYGCLRSSRGRGTFVRPGPYGGALREIVVVCRGTFVPGDSSFPSIFAAIDTGDIPVRWVDHQFVARNADRFFTPGQAVIWVLPPASQIMFMHQLADRGIPQLLINRTYDDFNFVSTDPWESIADGLSRLFRDGDREIALVSRLPDAKSSYLPERLIAFYEECFACGAGIPGKWIFKRKFSDIVGDTGEMARQLFQSGPAPRNIFIAEEALLPPTILCASHCGLTVGRDYRILVFSQGVLVPEQPGIIMLHQPMQAFRMEVEHFLRRTASGDRSPFHVRLKTEVREGAPDEGK